MLVEYNQYQRLCLRHYSEDITLLFPRLNSCNSSLTAGGPALRAVRGS
jgi:hypothetical protein